MILTENKVFSHQLQLSVGSNLFKSFIAAPNSNLAAGYFSAEAEDAFFQQRSRSLLSQPHHLNWIAKVWRISLHITAMYLFRGNLFPLGIGTNPHSTCKGHLRIQNFNRNFAYGWRYVNIQFLFEEISKIQNVLQQSKLVLFLEITRKRLQHRIILTHPLQ